MPNTLFNQREEAWKLCHAQCTTPMSLNELSSALIFSHWDKTTFYSDKGMLLIIGTQ
jgi:hypothetical protein